MNIKMLFFTVIYFILLLVNINTVPTFAGDEKVYVDSTRALLNGSVDNNNHPLLAKSIWLYFSFLGNGYFGFEGPFVYRIGTVILTIFSLFIFYEVAKLYVDKKYAFLAPLLLAIDPMFFAFGRLVHLEVPSIFFLLCSFLFLSKYLKDTKLKYLSAGSIFLGLSLSVKFLSLGVFALLFIFLIIYLTKKQVSLRNLFQTVLLFLLLVLAGFTLGNIIFFFKDTGDVNFLNYVYDLFYTQFNSKLNLSGFQSSPAWSWFLIPQIITLYRINYLGRVEAIVAFQNPIIMLLTLFSFSYLVCSLAKKVSGKESSILLMIFFVGLYLPWFFKLHDTFYYYITPLLPLSILMVIKTLSLLKVINTKYLIFGSFLVFVLTYPLLIGFNVSKKYELFVYKYSLYEYPPVSTLFCQNCYPRK